MSHPAKFSNNIIELLRCLVDPEWTVLDPFAGTGKIHLVSDRSIGVELEPEWASLHKRTIVGNALCLPFADEAFDCVSTSPTYGNRLADSHNAKDGSVRHSYTHDLGRKLHAANSGQLQWGDAYRIFHVDAWKEVSRVVRHTFILNCSDHVRNKEVQPVVQWHLDTLEDLGWEVQSRIVIPTSRLGFGANREARVDGEVVAVLRR